MALESDNAEDEQEGDQTANGCYSHDAQAFGCGKPMVRLVHIHLAGVVLLWHVNGTGQLCTLHLRLHIGRLIHHPCKVP